jgi:hypothetical protein
MDEDQRNHLLELQQIHQARLNQLEVRDAQLGINAPPEVKNEIQYIRTEMIRIAKQLENQPVGSAPGIPVLPPLQPEYELDIAARRSVLSPGQLELLNYIHRSSYNRAFMTQDSIAEAFQKKWGRGELYYRLEQLRLLGFIERDRIKHDADTEKFLYRIAQVYFDVYGDHIPTS